mmetsp:Transcript_25861/g.40221  ORF Transcript_25861/g.40221 Transcript_25861/m.40221 type:complete len:207 (+) Transcript_25861:1236-1856(+)
MNIAENKTVLSSCIQVLHHDNSLRRQPSLLQRQRIILLTKRLLGKTSRQSKILNFHTRLFQMQSQKCPQHLHSIRTMKPSIHLFSIRQCKPHPCHTHLRPHIRLTTTQLQNPPSILQPTLFLHQHQPHPFLLLLPLPPFPFIPLISFHLPHLIRQQCLLIFPILFLTQPCILLALESPCRLLGDDLGMSCYGGVEVGGDLGGLDGE